MKIVFFLPINKWIEAWNDEVKWAQIKDEIKMI